jgi:hypothetical protein
MTPAREKPGVAFWTTVVVVVVLVGYPLSFGPACWVTSRTSYGAKLIPLLYYPIVTQMSVDVDELAYWHLRVVDLGIARITPTIKPRKSIIDWYSRLAAAEDAIYQSLKFNGESVLMTGIHFDRRQR